MAGILNVNNALNSSIRKVSGKLSFDIGQVFLARVIKGSGDNNNEILLRLLDGWQFPAELLNGDKVLSHGPIKFQVEGFKEGKLQLKVVEGKEEKTSDVDSSIDSALLDQNIEVDKEEYNILEKMVKHNMPLTKSNIAQVKTIVDMANKVALSDGEQDNFILRQLNSKDIPVESPKGKEVSETLKSFFNELKGLNSEDILTMLENGIDFTEENIKSYKAVFKEDTGLFNTIREVKQAIDNIVKGCNEEDFQFFETDKQGNTGNINIIEKDIEVMDKPVDIKKAVINSLEESNSVKENTTLKDSSNIKNNINGKENVNIKEDIITNKIEVEVVNVQGKTEESIKNIKHKPLENTTEMLVKQQLNNKTEEIKDVIKTILKISSDNKPEVADKIVNLIKQNISDFKVFNSVSNQYYYMDVPVKVDNRDYDSKLIIKDERGKGKKIDSKNVKIAASVNTINLGVVDAYIKVNNSAMEVDIKCHEHYMKLLEKGKEKLVKDLSQLGYNVYIDVEKKQEKLNLSTCASFFEDSSMSSLNVRV